MKKNFITSGPGPKLVHYKDTYNNSFRCSDLIVCSDGNCIKLVKSGCANSHKIGVTFQKSEKYGGVLVHLK